jgi:DNA-binding LacI/PurR family transcriptional regulator
MGIIEFARLAGVSIATVSRAFTGNGRVSKKTADKILRLAAKYGFTPNVHASRRSSRESKSIGLIVVLSKDHPGESEVREMALDVAAAIVESGYSANVMVSSNLRDRIFQRVVTGGGVDGLIVAAVETQAPGTMRRMAGHLPCVLLGSGKNSATPGFGVVSIGSREGLAAAVGRLTQLGHRRIAFIDDGRDEDKLIGYKKGLYVAGIPFEHDMMETTGGRFEQGTEAIRKLLGRRTFSAVVAATDLLALGALAGIQETGRRVPGALSVVGFGDLDCARWSAPPLSTVGVNHHEMGMVAMAILADMIRERKKAKTDSQPRWSRSVQPVFVERGTTGPNQRMSTQYHRAE